MTCAGTLPDEVLAGNDAGSATPALGGMTSAAGDERHGRLAEPAREAHHLRGGSGQPVAGWPPNRSRKAPAVNPAVLFVCVRGKPPEPAKFRPLPGREAYDKVPSGVYRKVPTVLAWRKHARPRAATCPRRRRNGKSGRRSTWCPVLKGGPRGRSPVVPASPRPQRSRGRAQRNHGGFRSPPQDSDGRAQGRRRGTPSPRSAPSSPGGGLRRVVVAHDAARSSPSSSSDRPRRSRLPGLFTPAPALPDDDRLKPRQGRTVAR
jgi:hypothetical protein